MNKEYMGERKFNCIWWFEGDAPQMSQAFEYLVPHCWGLFGDA